MRIILLKDIENLGKKYEIKEVKDGYARNFLIPKGLAKVATKEALKNLQLKRKIEEEKAEEELMKIQKIASAIDGQEVVVSVKVGKEGQLFESVTAKKIYDKIKKFNIKKKQIILPEPIKSLGEFPVKIKFEHNLEAEITVIVVEGENE